MACGCKINIQYSVVLKGRIHLKTKTGLLCACNATNTANTDVSVSNFWTMKQNVGNLGKCRSIIFHNFCCCCKIMLKSRVRLIL